MQETRKLDDELFPAPHFAPDSKSLDQPDPAEDSAPASPHTRFHGNGQAVLSDWSSEYEEPARSVVLDDSTSSKASVSASQADRNTAAPPSAIDPRERLKAALDLEPHKVSNAPLTQMPDREEYITWEREINIKMDQMFAEITARDKKQDKEGTDDAIVKRTHLQMLCLPNPRPKHMEALAAVFQRERESLLASPKPEAIASTGVPKTNNGPRVSGLLGSLKKLGMFFGCRSSATASTDTDALHSPSQPRSAPSGSLFERLRRKVFGKL
ncbi:hypothetical protein CPB85DRAFT_952625 [Mucidula mucida]|nr:hypothetical protein CPB85DRAFT_952625 [Mucidula mucida]